MGSWVERLRKHNEERWDRLRDQERLERRDKAEKERLRRKEDLKAFYRNRQIMKIAAEKARIKAEEEEERRRAAGKELEEILKRKELERQQGAQSDAQ